MMHFWTTDKQEVLSFPKCLFALRLEAEKERMGRPEDRHQAAHKSPRHMARPLEDPPKTMFAFLKPFPENA